jgi:hypothetical protein
MSLVGPDLIVLGMMFVVVFAVPISIVFIVDRQARNRWRSQGVWSKRESDRVDSVNSHALCKLRHLRRRLIQSQWFAT